MLPWMMLTARRPSRVVRPLVALVLAAESLVGVQGRPAGADEAEPVPSQTAPAEPSDPAPPAPAPTPPRPPVRTMALGDSITEGYPLVEGYRGLLGARLAAAGLPAEFGGTQRQRLPGATELVHEGHGRYRIDQVRAGVPAWMAAAQPDTVLLMVGTNDFLGNFDPANGPARLEALLDTIAVARPTAAVLVSSIPPIAAAWCACQAGVDAYNRAVRRLVEERAVAGYPVSFVDMSAVGLADLADGVHPGETGYAKIADAWFSALETVQPGPRAPGPPPEQPADGYWMVGADGGVFATGGAAFHGSAAGTRLNHPVVAAAPTPTGKGYWLAAADGAVFAFGDARYYGGAAGLRLNRPIVAVLGMPTGRGYWLVASDGGIFSFGDARFFGSTGGLSLNRPIVAAAPTPSGGGYRLVASDGGVFAFGDATFAGSAAAIPLRSPVVGMATTPTGRGYWFVAADGGVFAFGDATFRGSLAGVATTPVTGMASSTDGRSYVLATAGGGMRGFGGAPPSTDVPVAKGLRVAAVVRAGA